MRSVIGMLGVGLLFAGLHSVAEAEPAKSPRPSSRWRTVRS